MVSSSSTRWEYILIMVLFFGEWVVPLKVSVASWLAKATQTLEQEQHDIYIYITTELSGMLSGTAVFQ